MSQRARIPAVVLFVLAPGCHAVGIGIGFEVGRVVAGLCILAVLFGVLFILAIVDTWWLEPRRERRRRR